MWVTYSEKGTRIQMDFWDWACMYKVMADYMETLDITEDEAYIRFWDDVRNYDPADFDGLLRGEPLEKAVGDGRMDEIRADYLHTLGIAAEWEADE